MPIGNLEDYATSGGASNTTPYQQQVNSANWNSNVYNLLGQYGINEMSYADRQLANANQMAQLELQAGGSRRDIGADLARLGLGREGLGIDQAALERQFPFLAGLHDIQMQLFGMQEGEARYGAGRQRQNLTGETAARGAIGTPGYQRGLTDIQKQLQGQLGRINLGRRGEKLQYGESVADIRDALKKLGLKGRELDIAEQQLRARSGDIGRMLGLQRQANQIGAGTDAFAHSWGQGQILQQLNPYGFGGWAGFR